MYRSYPCLKPVQSFLKIACQRHILFKSKSIRHQRVHKDSNILLGPVGLGVNLLAREVQSSSRTKVLVRFFKGFLKKVFPSLGWTHKYPKLSVLAITRNGNRYQGGKMDGNRHLSRQTGEFWWTVAYRRLIQSSYIAKYTAWWYFLNYLVCSTW